MSVDLQHCKYGVLSRQYSVGPLSNPMYGLQQDKPDFDLQLLVHQIDTLLVDYNNQLRKRNPNREKLASVQANLASASDASNLREQASFFFQTNRYPDGMLRRSTPDKHSSVEWYWKYSLGCSKVFNSGRRWKDLKGCTKPQWMADGQDLQQHSRSPTSSDPAPRCSWNKREIGEVIQQLDWKDDTTTAAVIVNGIGGSGKITLGDAVYPSFKYKFYGWKHSKITIIQNPEKNLKVEDLQSLILQDMAAIKQSGRDFENGC
ncbi:hypothetical protein SUGI_0712860 [Cryptomeria japonica]|nr:hypothetical protein SUGI_0712860 [Cryptomeria japonica]